MHHGYRGCPSLSLILLKGIVFSSAIPLTMTEPPQIMNPKLTPLYKFCVLPCHTVEDISEQYAKKWTTEWFRTNKVNFLRYDWIFLKTRKRKAVHESSTKINIPQTTELLYNHFQIVTSILNIGKKLTSDIFFPL